MPIGFKLFTVEIVTPERAWPPVRCTFAAVPAYDGQIGFLAGRAPLVCKLGIGQLRLEVEGAWKRFNVRDGFAEMRDGVLTVLTENAAAVQNGLLS